MAEPGLSEIVTTTLRNRTKVLKDNVSNNNAAFVHMKDTDSFESLTGGRTMIEEMWYAELGSWLWYQGGQTLNTNYNPSMTAAEDNWKQGAVGIPFTGLELRQNAGPEGIIKLTAARMKAGEFTVMNKVNASFFGDGTGSGSKEPVGLPALISKTPTTGTVAGIDRSTSAGTFYRNYALGVVATFGAALSAANAIQVFTRVKINIEREPDKANVALLGNTYYEAITNAAQAKQHIISDPKTANLGFENIVFCGLPMYLAGGVNFGGETLIGDTEAYVMNTKYLKLKYHQDCFMDPLEDRYSLNQDAMIKYIAVMYNFMTSNAKLQARVFDS